MPYRLHPIATGLVYHVFNRSVANQTIHIEERDYRIVMETMYFYSFDDLKIRFSEYRRMAKFSRLSYIEKLTANHKRLVKILSFCIMPNHFHLLLEELQPGGISKFLRCFQNSYARFFNVKYKRVGAVFQAMFKAVLVTSDEQLLHVHRYIHLNPYTSYIVKDLKKLELYEYSSYKNYLGENLYPNFIETEFILSFFPNLIQYKKFISDQADYQRTLGEIQHLLLEDSYAHTPGVWVK